MKQQLNILLRNLFDVVENFKYDRRKEKKKQMLKDELKLQSIKKERQRVFNQVNGTCERFKCS